MTGPHHALLAPGVRTSGASYTVMKERNVQGRHSFGVLPPPVFTFDMLFLRMLYHRMHEIGYYSKENGGVHIAIFRRCMRRLLDMFDSELSFNFVAFGGYRNANYISWNDFRVATTEEKLPEIELKVAERIFMVLDGQTNSLLGFLWCAIIFGCIISNVVIIIVQTVEEDFCKELIHDSRCHGTMNVCSIIFSVDYLGRLLSSPWCRHGIFNLEWVIEHAVIDVKDPHAPAPTQATPWKRLWFFASVPMHIVDLLSIIPFWLSIVASQSHISLGALRSLRLLRLFRVMKFGKFSSMLLVLGDTFRRSVQSIAVLILYMLMISLLAGAIIYRFESDAAESGAIEEVNPVFHDVPSSLWWVVTRMVSMQHSLPGAHGFPSTWVSSILVACVGMFKGVIFVLPIGQMTAAFKDSWAHQQSQEQLRAEVDRQMNMPVGFEWTQDPMSPVARLELYYGEKGGPQQDDGSYGALPLPLFSAKPVDCTLWVAIHGSMSYLSPCASDYPEMNFRIVWEPFSDSRPKEKMPHGQLKLQLLEGQGFAASSDLQWGCLVKVPVGLHGDDAVVACNTGLSNFGGSSPSWEGSGELSCEISWADDDGPKQPKPAPESSEELFQRQVLQMLEEQSQRISTLERELLEARAARLAT